MNWSNINTSLMLRLTKNFNLNLNATWDVYTYQLSPTGAPVRVNVPRWKAGKGIGKLSSTGTSFSYTFNNNTFKRGKDKDKDKKKKGRENQDDENWDGNIDPRENARKHSHDDDGEEPEMGADGYMKWSVPWSFTFNYSINYSYGSFNTHKSASYNFDTKKIAYMNCNISRDLHCFAMTASFIPIGPYKSYNFHIAVKSSLLSDLKYDKRSSYSNGLTWY